jgi:hypothetical protein
MILKALPSPRLPVISTIYSLNCPIIITIILLILAKFGNCPNLPTPLDKFAKSCYYIPIKNDQVVADDLSITA